MGHMALLGAGKPPVASAADATVLFTATEDTAGASVQNKTYSSIAIGTASADRYVVVALAIQQAPGIITSLTVGGQSTTLLLTSAGGGGTRTVALFITDAPVTSGTTANIVVNLTAVARSSICVYAVTGLLSNIPTDTASTVDIDNDTMSLDVSAGGVAIGAAQSNNATSFTCTGLTEDADNQNSTNQTITSASAAFAAAQTLSVAFDAVSASSYSALCVSFR